MAYSPFRFRMMLRIIMLAASIFFFFYFLVYQNYYLASSVILAASVVQVYLLFRYFDHTNREISKFFNSIRFSDFSQNFLSRDTDDSFKELKSSLINVMNQFRQARSEKEEQFQYLQTVVRHIGIGLISFKQNGEVELINNSAKRMLSVPDLKNLNNLPPDEQRFLRNLVNLKSGAKELIKISGDGREQHLAMSAVEFKMHGEKYTLASLQDITSELERERMANEFEIAHRVQTRLLPKSDPVIKDFSISAVCLPAKEVGGDYYDYITLKDGKIGIVIGDVAGKGMPAAFYMTLTKGIFQACASQEENPRDVLVRVNEIICKSMVKGSFVTLIYAVLDPETKTLTFVRAGHDPLLIYKSNEKKLCEFKPSGMGVGLDCSSLFKESLEECRISLAEGDILFFCTDGLAELRDKNNQEFSHARIKSNIINNCGLSARELTLSLINELKNHKGDVMQYDDLTIIAVKCNKEK